MDSRLTPSSARSFGHEMDRSPGTSTNRKSSGPRRTTRVFTTSAGGTPRACAASARLPTGPWLISRYRMPAAARASCAGLVIPQQYQNDGMPADQEPGGQKPRGQEQSAAELTALRDQCTRFLHYHGPVRVADL